MGALTVADLVVEVEEPRILDVVLSDRLGFAHIDNLRKLILRNAAELRRYGGLSRQVVRKAESETATGRPEVGHLLNEAQALLVCLFSRTERAADVREEVINAYLAWRRGVLPPVPLVDQQLAIAGQVGLSERQVSAAWGRAAVLDRMWALENDGRTTSEAVMQAAKEAGVAASTVWNWKRRITDVPDEQLLQALAPGYRGGGRKAEIDPEIWELFCRDRLRTPPVSFSLAYALAREEGQRRRMVLPSAAAFRRRWQREALQAMREAATPPALPAPDNKDSRQSGDGSGA